MKETQASPALPFGDWFTLGRFALLLGCLIFAAFPQVVLGLQTFVVRDFGFFVHPLAYYQRQCFWRGELPLWNPYNNCGVPFLAQWNTMPLYPPVLFYLLLPLTWALSVFSLLHLFFAGLGMYCLAYRWTGNRLAAAVAGLIFAFNGLSLNLLMWPSHIATFSWMPWVVLSVEQGWQRGGRHLFLGALAGAMQMLAGGPETILFTWLLLSALWVTQLVRGNRPDSLVASLSIPNPPSSARSALLYRFPLTVLLVAALAAAQILPFLDLAAHSQRDAGYADTRWSMPAFGWANFLVPMVFGHVWTMGVFFQHQQSWTSSYYLGVGALLLVLLGIWSARERRVAVLLAGSGLALVLAFGNHTLLGRGLRRLIPQLSLMTYPIKFVLLVVFATPLLAAFGLRRLVQVDPAKLRSSRTLLLLAGGLLLALIAGILLWAWRSPLPLDDFPATLRNGLERAAFLAAALLLLAGLQGAARAEALKGRFPVLLSLGLLLVFWLDVWTHEPPQNPTAAPSIYEPGFIRSQTAMHPQPDLGQSRAMVSPAAEVKFTGFILSDPGKNLLIKRLGYFANLNLLDGVPKVNGFFSLYPHECGELTSVLYGSTNAYFPRLADFMSVSQLTAPGEFFKWAPRDSFLPLATAGQRPIFLDDTNTVHALIRPDFDGRRVVFLPEALKGTLTVTNETHARVVQQHFSAHRVDLQVEAAEPSLVVLSQTYYHRWQALVDGRATRLLRANYAFQAVEVPAGTHRVELVYRDRAFVLGAIISLAALLLCAGGWWWARRLEPQG